MRNIEEGGGGVYWHIGEQEINTQSVWTNPFDFHWVSNSEGFNQLKNTVLPVHVPHIYIYIYIFALLYSWMHMTSSHIHFFNNTHTHPSYRRCRTQRTSLNTEPGSLLEALLSQLQHKSLTNSKTRDKSGFFTTAVVTLHVFTPCVHANRKTRAVSTYHRKRGWPVDSSPAEEPTYSRYRDKPGRSLPKHRDRLCSSW